MFLMIFLSGMFVSILMDLYFYTLVKNGTKIDSYPTEYLRYTKYQLFRSWVLWSIIWFVIMGMTIYNNVRKNS